VLYNNMEKQMSAQTAFTKKGRRHNWSDDTYRHMYLALVSIKINRPDRSLLDAVREAQNYVVPNCDMRVIGSTSTAEKVWARAQLIARATPRPWFY
jgi:fructose-specific component phosphotransferase system IIB-like protein